MRKFKEWLIVKLGGMTQSQHYSLIEAFEIKQMENFIQSRARAYAKDAPILVLTNTPFTKAIYELEDLFTGEINDISHQKLRVTVGEQLFIIVHAHMAVRGALRSMNIKGYVYL